MRLQNQEITSGFLNLNRLNKALVFDYNQEVIETSMDDIEIQIVFDYYNKNKKYMEV